MTSEQIEVFLNSHLSDTKDKMVNINFKTRNAIRGFFPEVYDSEDLKLKNFWRVITEGNLESWNQTKSMSLTRIFSGNEITRLKL